MSYLCTFHHFEMILPKVESSFLLYLLKKMLQIAAPPGTLEGQKHPYMYYLCLLYHFHKN